MKAPLQLGVLGGGNMGEAILRGLTQSGQNPFGPIRVYDPNSDRRDKLSQIPGVEAVLDPSSAVEAADVILLAVKPQRMADALAPVAELAAGRLFVSIAAGTTAMRLESLLPGGRVVRTMPNTPLMVGRGVVGLCRGATATEGDLEVARRLFPGATMVEVEESQMDALTAVSGSGPAYFFRFVEALATAAQGQGFDAQTAYRLAAGTFTGAAALLEQSGAGAAELRQRVTSPGGTTAAALEVFEQRGLERLVTDAVAAAADRGRELAT